MSNREVVIEHDAMHMAGVSVSVCAPNSPNYKLAFMDVWVLTTGVVQWGC